jgi:Major Facilitator Superfamily/Cyclic nucleotide-binding domain
MLAYAATVIAEWSVWVGVVVYAYDRGGATAAGFTSLGLLVPSMIVAPVTGRAADARRPIRLLFGVYVAQSIAFVAAAVAAFADAPPLVVIGLITVVVTAMAFVRPALSVVVPGLVRSARELTAANLLSGYCDSGAVLLGPLVAAGLLAIKGPELVFAACATLAILAAVSTLPLIQLDPPPSQFADDEPTSARLREAVRALARRPGAISLLAVLAGQYVLIGALDLLYVILAVEVLGMQGSGAGVLSAMFGAGALAGGLLSTVLVGRRRLAPLIVFGICVITLAMLAFGATTTVVAAVIALPVAGIGRSVVDLTGRMLLQRAAPQNALASVFAVMEGLSGVGIVIGVVLVQVTVAAAGPRVALVALAAVFGVLLAFTSRGLRRVDATADAPVVAIRHLRNIAIFAHLPGPALEGVARAATEMSVHAGDVVIRERDVGDQYYAITSGHVQVTQEGAYVRTMSRGTGFGEIALLADVPRTATVTADDDATLLAIERVPFLTAVTGHDASARTAWSVAREWHPALAEDATE